MLSSKDICDITAAVSPTEYYRPTGELVSLVVIVIFIVIITFTRLALKGVHRRQIKLVSRPYAESWNGDSNSVNSRSQLRGLGVHPSATVAYLRNDNPENPLLTHTAIKCN